MPARIYEDCQRCAALGARNRRRRQQRKSGRYARPAGIEIREAAKYFVIARRALDIVTAEREHDDFRLRIEHLLPFDLSRRLMFPA